LADLRFRHENGSLLTNAPAFVFLAEDGETAGAAVARCAREALAGGPMGCHLRGDHYRSFLEIRGPDAYGHPSDSLSYVHTSCAVFAGTCRIHAGVQPVKPWHAEGRWGITSWLGTSFQASLWVPHHDGEPSVGAVLYWGSLTGGNGHVGIVLERVGDLYLTAEGGGSLHPDEMKGMTATQIHQTQGTVCRMSAQPKDISTSWGRPLQGWWIA
jgi:hypothetical protein